MIQNQPNQEAFESPRSGSSGEFAMDSHVSHVENQTNLQECGEFGLGATAAVRSGVLYTVGLLEANQFHVIVTEFPWCVFEPNE